MTKKMNDLSGREWLQNSFTIWRDIRKTAEEKALKHPAMFPEQLASRLIQCYTKKINDDGKPSVVLDPFSGIGSTVIASYRLGRYGVGIELSSDYIKLSKNRLNSMQTNLENFDSKNQKPKIINSSAVNLTDYVEPSSVDFCVTSPPYWDILNQRRTVDAKSIRKYSDSEQDIGNISDYKEFLDKLEEIFTSVFTVLKPKSRCAVVVMDIRKKSQFFPLHIDLSLLMQKIGFELEEFVIWDRQHEYNFMTTLGYPYVFRFNKVHEFICIFNKPA